MPISIIDFFNFLDKYKGRPTESGMEKFFHDDLMVGATDDDFCDDAKSFEDGGCLALLVETLEKLTSGEGWALVTSFRSASVKMICLIPQMPNNWLIVDDVKAFRRLGQDKKYVDVIPSSEGDSIIERHPMKNMPDKSDWGDISVGGTWFDSDDDWNYTYLSRFFQSYVDFSDEDTKAWLVQFTSTPMMGELLNWMFDFYESLFEIVGVKV